MTLPRERAPSVPWLLVKLKTRLLINRARSDRRSRGQLLFGGIAGAVAAIAGAAAALAVGTATSHADRMAAIVLGATVVFVAWTLLPLIAFGTDETLDPARLALLPLRRRPLMTGLVLASLVGFAPAAVIITAAAAVVGYSQRAAFLVGLPAMALLVLLSITAARALATSLAASLSSRKGRDAAAITAAVLVVAVQAVRFVRLPAGSTDVFVHVADAARWLPPGMLGHAVIDARDGRWVLAVAELLPAAALIPLLLRVWAGALERSTTKVASGATATRRRSADRASLPLVLRHLSFLGRSRWGAVAAKELRYVAREPRRKVLLLNSVIIGVGGPIWLAIRRHGDVSHGAVLLSTLAAWVAILAAMNQFGFDGAAAWIDATSGDATRAVIVGKNAALAMEITPLVGMVALVVAAITGGWAYLPAALLLGVAGLGAGLATANVVSVRYPVRLPESASPFAGGGGGQGLGRAMVLLVCSLVQGALLAPLVAAAIVGAAVAPVSLLITAPLCAVYGAGLWLVGLGMATSYGRSHQPELLRAIDPSKTD